MSQSVKCRYYIRMGSNIAISESTVKLEKYKACKNACLLKPVLSQLV
jgi:hypothetical protein